MSDSKTSPLTTVNNKNGNSTKKQLTLDDLAKLINTLSSSQNKGFESINKRIDDMIVHLSKLDSDLDDCRKKIDNLEERVVVLETRNTADTTTESKDMSLQIINEVIDIQKRSVNIIIHGLDESPIYRPLVIPPSDISSLTSFIKNFDNILPSYCTISLDEVSDGLRSLYKSNSPGPDGISGFFLSSLSDSIAYPVFLLFNKSLKEGVFPSLWKISSITPVFKKGNKSDIKNYRPISGLVQLGKLLEKLVLRHIIDPINNILDNSQHGFRPGRSTLSCNLTLQHFILESFKNNSQVDVIYTDFEKAFDRVDHNLLAIALKQLGFGDPLLSWLNSYLTNRSHFTSVLGYSSSLSPVPSVNNLTNKNLDVDPIKPMSSYKPKNEIDSTSLEEVPIEIDDEEPTESSNSSNVLTKISIIDPRKMMDDDNYIRFINEFLNKKPPITYVETSDVTN
ncbi:hypothetical protein QTP88_029317 [Uroleucon formosanum]